MKLMMFSGDRQVSVGDVLPDCGARVTAIEAGGVRLDCQGQELFAELPPLRVLRRQTSSQRSDSAAFDQLELEAQSASYLENDR